MRSPVLDMVKEEGGRDLRGGKLMVRVSGEHETEWGSREGKDRWRVKSVGQRDSGLIRRAW